MHIPANHITSYIIQDGLEERLSMVSSYHVFHANLTFPPPIPHRQLAVWPVSSAGTVMDNKVKSDAASTHLPTVTFPWKLQTPNTYPVSVWHDLPHDH